MLEVSMRVTFGNCPYFRRLNFFRVSRQRCQCLATAVSISDSVQELVNRGLVGTTFPDTLLSEKHLLEQVPPCVYAGFDATADSLHIGNLLILCTLLRLRSRGFSIIALIGEATARLGDPSGLTKDRPAVSAAQVAENARTITSQVTEIFANFDRLPNVGTSPMPLVLNNAEWFDHLSVADFFTVVGRSFRLRHMLGKECVRGRLNNEGMNYSEFSYQIFQAYDWLELYKRTGCLLQLGGIDQTGNIHSGHDLLSKYCGCSAYGLLVPLLLSSTGKKLGKTSGTTLWLSPKRTSSYSFYQHLLNLPDSEMPLYYRWFCFLSLQEIDAIMEQHKLNPEARHAQRLLAEQLTSLVHGPEGLSVALRVTEILHHNQLFTISSMCEHELQMLQREVPSVQLRFQPGANVSTIALEAGCFDDIGSACRVIKQGGFYINGHRIVDPSMEVSSDLMFSLSKLLDTGWPLMVFGHFHSLLMEVVHRVSNGVCSVSRVCRPNSKLADIDESELKVRLPVEHTTSSKDDESSDGLSSIVLKKKIYLPLKPKSEGVCLPLLGITVIILCVAVGFLIGWLVAIFETRKIIAVTRRANPEAIAS